MTTESHICVLDHPYPGGVMGCACGRFWIMPGRDILRFAFISAEMLHRLRDYQAEVRYGRAESIADAVSNAERLLRERRETGAVKARNNWQRRQSQAQAKWWRCVRKILLPAPCAYCGDPAAGLDHIVPVSRGGLDRQVANLAPACVRCNSEKGNRTPLEWKAWRLRRGRPWPPVRTEAAA